ncbi:hypothetical protein VN97_g1167 [Penicillium thymicola]|uniref:Uncharacterized protein n=1 Tax=Penicillium thymicola TaxID=293382 RepID=A0AAI9TS77_PENTH|nr:hypothetical protein VN97_g1167 [Penicillium thymicola]
MRKSSSLPCRSRRKRLLKGISNLPPIPLRATKYATGTYNSLLYKDSPTPKLAAKRSANFLQIQFRFTSDSL